MILCVNMWQIPLEIIIPATPSLQALCRAEDEEDIVAASQAKAEQVAELAEFNENIPLDDGGEQEEVEELSKAEQEIAALVEQVSNGGGLDWLD